MTTSVDPSLSAGESIFESLIWKPAVDAGLVALKASVPVLAVWPLSTILDGVVNALSNFLFGQTKLLVDLTSIQLMDAVQQKAYETASEKLRIIAHDQGVQSDAFIQAREAAKTSLSNLVHFNS